MNDDSSLRSSRVMLTAGIVICSILTVCSLMNLSPRRLPAVLSVGRDKPAAIREANRQLSKSYAEFYPNQYRSTGVIRTVSQSDEQPIAAHSDPTPESPRHRDVFQKDHIVELEQRETSKKSGLSDSVHHSSRLSTSTVVEAGGEYSDGAADRAGNESGPLLNRDISTTQLPHITVPVTVNVDNGEILTELMRLQEEVIVTRQQLADSSESFKSSTASIAAPQSDDQRSPTSSTAVTTDERAMNTAIVEDRRSLETELAVRTQTTAESVASTEASFDPFDSEVSDISAAPESTTADAESAPDFSSTPDSADPLNETPAMAGESDVELPDFGDFSEPNGGPSEEGADESLPAFELPQTRTSKPSSLNSYAEWVQSFETSEDEQIILAGFEEELPSFPVMESEPAASESAVADIAAPLLTVPAEPSFDVESSEPTNESPSTPVPPVPASSQAYGPPSSQQNSSDLFHEPSTIPVFPATSTKIVASNQESAPAPTRPSVKSGQESNSVRTAAKTVAAAPSSNSEARPHGTRKTASRVAIARSMQAQRATGKPSSYQSQMEQKNGPSIASRLKSFASPSDSGPNQSPGMMARMKSRVSSVVAKVPKPDVDTPMWVDRLADWKDERFGKKNTTEPKMTNPSTTIAAQVPHGNTVNRHPQAMANAPAAASRPNAVRQPVTSVPQTRTNSQVVRSSSQPRANVTTVPRAGRTASPTNRTSVAQVPLPTQHPIASAVPNPQSIATATPEKPAAAPKTISGASYSNDSSIPIPRPITQTAHASVEAPPAALPEINRPQQQILRAPVNIPVGVQHGRDTYYGVVAPHGNSPVASTYGAPVTHPAPVSYPVVQEHSCDTGTEYIGTLDAFNYRMTMVIRPPSFSNLSANPVSRWFSNSNTGSSGSTSPTVHRVSSAIRYSTQPKTVR